MADKIILVTGATGKQGGSTIRHLVKSLVDAGTEGDVRVFVRLLRHEARRLMADPDD